MGKRNNELIMSQNLLAMALAKNAWDEAKPAPNGAEVKDSRGFYILDGIDGRPWMPSPNLWTGFSYAKMCFPQMTTEDYDVENVIASCGETVNHVFDENFKIAYRSQMTTDSHGNRVLQISSSRELNRYKTGLIGESPTPSSVHFYFATWFDSKKIRIYNSPNVAGIEVELVNEVKRTLPASYNLFSAAVYEIEDVDHSTRVLNEQDVEYQTTGFFETKPYTWYYISITCNGYEAITDNSAYEKEGQFCEPFNIILGEVEE